MITGFNRTKRKINSFQQSFILGINVSVHLPECEVKLSQVVIGWAICGQARNQKAFM